MSDGLRPCPLCRHDAKLHVGHEENDGVMVNKIRCAFCGCEIGAPYRDDKEQNVKYLEYLANCWNNRAEYCQYCGELVGAVERCPKCNMSLVMS